jgi:hypothetical protein
VGGRDEAGWFPVGGGDANEEDAEHHEGEVEDAHPEKGVADGLKAVGFEVGHEVGGERGADHGSSAEAHDGEAGGEAGAVWKPFDEGGDGRDVAKAHANAADAAVAEIDEGEGVELDAESGDEEAEAEASGGDEHGFAGAGGLKPLAEERGGDAEDGDGEGEDVADLLMAPGVPLEALKASSGLTKTEKA